MRFIKLEIKSISILTLVAVFTILYTYQVYAEQRIDDKCYKVNSQIVLFDLKGLEVDSKGNIYIGFAGGINVYDDSGVFKYGIKVKTPGDFQMKIDNNDMINIALIRERKIRVYNKEGYITQEKDDNNNETYYEYKKDNRIKEDSKGNEYKLTNFFGYTKVVKTTPDGLKTTIYKIPPLAWTLKLLAPIFMMIFALVNILIFIVLKKGSKRV